MKKLIAISIAIVGLTLSACKKEGTDTPVSVTFTIDQPTENATIAFGDDLHMEGTITGTGQLHGYTMELIDQSDASVDYIFESNTHATEYTFHEHYQNAVLQTTNYTLRIVVGLDHQSSETESKELNVTFVEE